MRKASDLSREIMSQSFKDQEIILDLIRLEIVKRTQPSLKALDLIEKELYERMRKEGVCPHVNLLEISTFQDFRNGVRMYLCRDCNEKIAKEFKEEDMDWYEDED